MRVIPSLTLAVVGLATLLVAGPVLGDMVAPGWVDYTDGSWSTWTSSTNNQPADPIQLGFTFDFYGGAYSTTEVRIQSNGYLGFGPNLLNANDPGAWPRSSGFWEGSARIAAPMWYDFQPNWSNPGTLYYGTIGSGNDQRFVVTWDTHTALAERNIFQLQLHEATGRIQYSYHTLEGVEGARVGVNLGDGVEYTGFIYDGGQNYDGGGVGNANQYGPTGSLEGWSIYYDFDSETGSYEATSQYIPEPGTMALLLVGLGAGAALKRRRSSD